MIRFSRRICALILLLVAAAGVLMSFGEHLVCSGEPPGVHSHTAAAGSQETGCDCSSTAGQHPAASPDGDGHFCIDACGCPCSAPMTVQPVRLAYAPTIGTIMVVDPFRHLPEIVLPRFIPPQNQA